MAKSKKWIQGSQLKLLESPNEIEVHHRSTVQDRLEDKVNGHLPQMLAYFSRASRFLTADTKERIQQETDPFLLGHALGDLYPRDQRLDLIHGLLWHEREPGESREDFLDRFPEVMDEIEEEITARARTAELRTETRKTVSTFRKQLLDRIGEVASDLRASPPRMRVSESHIAEWTRTQNWDNESVTYLPKLLECVRPTGQTDVDLQTYRETLTEAAKEQNMDVPTGWLEDTPEFETTQTEGHEMLLGALSDEIRQVVARYWDEQRIEEKDRLLEKAVDILEGLDDRQLQILARDPDRRNNRAEGWTRHDTRLANSLTEDGKAVDYPLLEMEEATSGKKTYHLTKLGSFVNRLHEEYGSYDPITAGFPDKILADVVEEALDEVTLS